MSNKSVKKNYIYNLIYQIFLVIVPLVVTPYVSRVLSPEGIGQYSFSYSLITYFTIFASLGFGYYAQREIAKHQDDIKRQSEIFWEINICRLLPVSIALVINVLLCIFKIYGQYSNLMLVFNINIISVALDIAFIYQGNENFSKIVIRNVIIKIISITFIFIFVKEQDDIIIYTFINSFMLIISNLSLWTNLSKTLVKIEMKKLKPFSHLKGTLALFIPTIATTIYTVLDKTLIGVLVDGTYVIIENGVEVVKKYSDLENGYYEQSEKLIKMAMTVITCIGTVMIPRNSKEFAEGNIEKIRSNIFTSSQLVMLIGLPMVLGLIATTSNFVPWFYGNGYDKCILLISLLSPLIIIIGFSNVFGLQYLIPSGNDKKFALALIAGSIVNVILNVILIPFFWSLGATIGTIVAELVVTIVMGVMVRKELNIFKVIVSSWKYILVSLVMFFSVLVVCRLLEPSFLNSCFLGFLGVFIYIILLIILKDKIVCNAINYLIKKLK